MSPLSIIKDLESSVFTFKDLLNQRFEFCVLWPFISLITFGLIMVASTTITFSDPGFEASLFYFWRQTLAIFFSVICCLLITLVPMKRLEAISTWLLFIHIPILFLVLVPSIGHEVNGATRWIKLFGFSYQPSEWVKLIMIIYISSYIVRHISQVERDLKGFLKPFIVVFVISFFLVLQPDFGSSVVVSCTALGMLFLARVPLLRFLVWSLMLVIVLSFVALSKPYRIERLMAFKDPWSDPLDKGWQLTQSLIAFGNGDWLGVGLGNSAQKLHFLPEGHTDFVFAIAAEETGVLGATIIVVCFLFLTCQVFRIAKVSIENKKPFGGFVAYGVGLSLGLQAFINIAVNVGVLPTKGLPLPFLSYANNNLVVSSLAIGMVLRVSYESSYRNTWHRGVKAL